MKVKRIGKPWDRPSVRCEVLDCPRNPKLYLGGFWICNYHEDKFYDYQKRQLLKQAIPKSSDIFGKTNQKRIKKNKKQLDW